jgi:DNA polymerase/3'-5' exonuclease PolX
MKKVGKIICYNCSKYLEIGKMKMLQNNDYLKKDFPEDERTLDEIAAALTEEAKSNGLTDEQLQRLLED